MRRPRPGPTHPASITTESDLLTIAEVADLLRIPVAALRYVLLLAYTGLRFGEMAALRVGRLDFRRRRAIIAESVTLVRAEQVFGTPKGHERREVPIPPFLSDHLKAHVAEKDASDLVFTGSRSGGALRAPVFRNAAFDPAAAMIGRPGLHPHELRHTASPAIASGADVKVVQQMLGHASAAMTFDQYGHLFGDRSTMSPTESPPPAKLLSPECCPRLKSSVLTNSAKRLQAPKYGACSVVLPAGFEPAPPPPESDFCVLEDR